MELREFAEQVLFSTSLKLKLQCPDEITDERPGTAINAPPMPGRPHGLEFKQRGERRDFPRLQELEQPEHRGRLLHFFANHELLATELMALVLLRFPDAPAAFRRGVLQTLKDEQEHTRWYMDRMQTSGMAFGDIPVSGYFWRAIAGMESPVDYVAGLSLTFEQANLDFARHYANAFSQVGDDATARLLDRIYRDEIGHVAYGLKWFRKWKNPSETDWDAFCRHLKFPLSPQRAKGAMSLNVEGRVAAGFDARFIEQLNVYSHSRGRTPAVFLFNPFAEGYIAGGKAFTPVKHQQQLARDLQNLPQFLCARDDIVLVNEQPSTHFLNTIKSAGFELPEFFPRERLGELKNRKLGRLRPWAWSPDSLEIFDPLFPSVTGEIRPRHERFNGQVANLYSKAWSAALLAELLDRFATITPHAPWLCPSEVVGIGVTTLQETCDAIASIRSRGHHRVVVKQSFGLAGQNAIRLWEPELLDSQKRWLESALQQPGGVVVEPWLERLIDFSIQLEMTTSGLKLIGYTGLENDAKGQFRANTAGPHFARRMPANVAAALAFAPENQPALHRLHAMLLELLEKKLRSAAYLGPLGIDSFVYRDSDGVSRLKPIVEVNPRYTMGRLAAELMRHTAPGSTGRFTILNRAALREKGFDSFAAYARALRESAPVCLEGSPVSRLRSGAVCLNEPEKAEVCLATWEVTRGAAFRP